MKIKKYLIKNFYLFVLILLLCYFIGYENIKATIISQTDIVAFTDEADDFTDSLEEGSSDQITNTILHAMSGVYGELTGMRNKISQYTSSEISNDNLFVEDKTISFDNRKFKIRIIRQKSLNNEITPALIYFHGGGFVFGDLNYGSEFCLELAKSLNITVLNVDYPLAPENDSNSIISYCFDFIDAIGNELNAEILKLNREQINICGDGAGANIALNTVYEIIKKRNNIKDNYTIKTLILYYPVLITNPDKTKSLRAYARGYGFDKRLLETIGNVFNKDNQINALFEDLENLKLFPSTLIVSAERDIVIDSNKPFIEILLKQNPNNKSIIFDGSIHGFLIDKYQKTAFRKALNLTEQFIRVNE